MMKTTLITTYDYDGQSKSTITHETDAVVLPELLIAIEDHLRGCGFHFNGHLEIIDEEE